MKNLIDIMRHQRLQRKGQRLLNQGRPREALAFFEKAVLLQNDPEDRFNMALALVGLSRHQEAIAHLEKIEPEQPENEVLLLLMADCSMQLRRWDDAIGYFSRLAKIRPGSERYTRYLALTRDPVARDKHVAARELFGQSQALLDQKKPHEALEKMREAFEMDPDNAVTANNLGSLMLLMKQPPDEALIYFEKAVALEPDNQRFRENLSWVKRKAKL